MRSAFLGLSGELRPLYVASYRAKAVITEWRWRWQWQWRGWVQNSLCPVLLKPWLVAWRAEGTKTIVTWWWVVCAAA